MKLDLEPEHLQRLLHAAADIVVRHQRDTDGKPIFPQETAAEIRARFADGLPAEPEAPEDLLRRVEREVLGFTARTSSPDFYGFVSTSGNPFALLGELLAAGPNQPVIKQLVSPSATAVERQVVRWIAEFVGYPADAEGLLVSGGSMANVIGLAVARKHRAPFDVAAEGLHAGPPLTAYVSDEGHHSLQKAFHLLGHGTRSLRSIPTGEDYTIDVAKLAARVEADRAAGAHPFCVIANGGTVNTGAVDPIDELADLCEKHGMWLHVDGAYGLPAAGTDRGRPLFRGLERADSICLDPHKWFYVQYEAACVLTRHHGALLDTFGQKAAYARSSDEAEGAWDLMDRGMQMSRGFRALKVWMTFRGYGARRLRAAIEENIETMAWLARQIEADPDFELLAPAPLSIVGFRYRPRDPRAQDEAWLDRINAALAAAVERDGRVYLGATRLRGRAALRACNVKYRTERPHVERLLEVLREIGAGVVEATAR